MPDDFFCHAQLFPTIDCFSFTENSMERKASIAPGLLLGSGCQGGPMLEHSMPEGTASCGKHSCWSTSWGRTHAEEVCEGLSPMTGAGGVCEESYSWGGKSSREQCVMDWPAHRGWEFPIPRWEVVAVYFLGGESNTAALRRDLMSSWGQLIPPPHGII